MINKLVSTSILIIAVFSLACGKAKPEAEDGHSVAVADVEIAPVTQADVPVTLTFPGHSEVTRRESVLSPIAGVVVSFRAMEGARFAPGETVATIVPKDASAAITGARTLRQRAANSEQQIEAERALALAESTENRVAVKTVSGGVVAERNVGQGDLVLEGAPLVTLIDLSTLVFLGEVSLSDLPKVRVGSAATIRFEAFPARLFPAAVVAFNPQSDRESQRVPVRLNFTDLTSADRGLLKSNMMGMAEVTAATHRQALIVPRAALLHDDENDVWNLLVAGPDSLAHRLEVTVGVLTDSLAEITAGALTRDMKVIVRGHYGLADSSRVSQHAMAGR